MSPFRSLAPVVLGLTLCLQAGGRFAAAEDAVIQRFGEWKITIQPGVRSSQAGAIPPAPRAATEIRLVSQTETDPVDQESLPPAPAQPETVSKISEPAPVPGVVTLPHLETAPCRSADPLSLVQIYPQVYNSIPFSRAEYEANPSYRHDATMEFLFGQLRPTVIQRGTMEVNHRGPNVVMPVPAYTPYGFNSYFYPFSADYRRPYSLW